jgi:hypothetical protein
VEVITLQVTAEHIQAAIPAHLIKAVIIDMSQVIGTMVLIKQVEDVNLNFFTMQYDNLSYSFEKMVKELELPFYLNEICTHIANRTISKSKVDQVLMNHNINISIAKVDFIHVILEYIKRTLDDGILTDEEKKNIKFLKAWFSIKPGDFYLHNKSDVEKVITAQLVKMYKDEFINDEEALLKVDLQEIFDLSFDEMNEYSIKHASDSISHGKDPKNLDIFLKFHDYFKLRLQD